MLFAPSMKCSGASMWVPVCEPSFRLETFAGSPRSVEAAEPMAMPGSPS